jgi:hypothetical protein
VDGAVVGIGPNRVVAWCYRDDHCADGVLGLGAVVISSAGSHREFRTPLAIIDHIVYNKM